MEVSFVLPALFSVMLHLFPEVLHARDMPGQCFVAETLPEELRNFRNLIGGGKPPAYSAAFPYGIAGILLESSDASGMIRPSRGVGRQALRHKRRAAGLLAGR